MNGSETFWTCIARCRVCKSELNRAVHVPELKKFKIELSAPLVSICKEKNHNTFSDCNIGVDLEWIKE